MGVFLRLLDLDESLDFAANESCLLVLLCDAFDESPRTEHSRRILEVHGTEGAREYFRHNGVARPLFVRWHHVPRRIVSGRRRNRVFPRLHVLKPPRTLHFHVRHCSVPRFQRQQRVHSQPRQLLVLRDVQKDLHDLGSVQSEDLFERIDHFVPLSPRGLRQRSIHASSSDVFVVRLVPESNVSFWRNAHVCTPQEVVLGLDGRWGG
mmetsp:Transcript_2460/g.4329  ORF Transcript_2460/g.4329 Transcript_2460/m.4329 type:complete len:207 (+) Transcript_2460:1696-2316(+)